MKKLIFLALLFFSLPLFAQEPTLTFSVDGKIHEYQLSEIETILFYVDELYNYQLTREIKIVLKNAESSYFPIKIVQMLKIRQNELNIYIGNVPQKFKLNEIDSIIFYEDSYQPITIGKQVWSSFDTRDTRWKTKDTTIKVHNILYIDEKGDDFSLDYENVSVWDEYNNDLNWGLFYSGNVANDKRQIAPEGWHVATENDWRELMNYYEQDWNKLRDDGQSGFAAKGEQFGWWMAGNGNNWFNPVAKDGNIFTNKEKYKPAFIRFVKD